ncbi:hypothetical protein Peur_037021 [Populus x canadensis]
MDPPPPPPPPPSTVPLLGPPHHEGGCLDSCILLVGYWEYSHFAVYGFCAAAAFSHAAALHCLSLCHLPPKAAFL